MTCFLIDDDHDDQEFFLLALANIDPNITCHMATDGSQAIQQLSDPTFTPDLIFLDMRMPKMCGADCIRELKKIKRLQSVPVILYSSNDKVIGNAEAKRAGADLFFTKTTSIPELSDSIDSVMKQLYKKKVEGEINPAI